MQLGHVAPTGRILIENNNILRVSIERLLKITQEYLVIMEKPDYIKSISNVFKTQIRGCQK